MILEFTAASDESLCQITLLVGSKNTFVHCGCCVVISVTAATFTNMVVEEKNQN